MVYRNGIFSPIPNRAGLNTLRVVVGEHELCSTSHRKAESWHVHEYRVRLGNTCEVTINGPDGETD